MSFPSTESLPFVDVVRRLDWRLKLLASYYCVAGVSLAVSFFWKPSLVLAWTMLNAESSFTAWQMNSVYIAPLPFFLVIALMGSLDLSFWVLGAIPLKLALGRLRDTLAPALKANYPRFWKMVLMWRGGTSFNDEMRVVLWLKAFARPVIFALSVIPWCYPLGIIIAQNLNIRYGITLVYIGNLTKLAVSTGIYAASPSLKVALAGILFFWAIGYYANARLKLFLLKQTEATPVSSPAP